MPSKKWSLSKTEEEEGSARLTCCVNHWVPVVENHVCLWKLVIQTCFFEPTPRKGLLRHHHYHLRLRFSYMMMNPDNNTTAWKKNIFGLYCQPIVICNKYTGVWKIVVKLERRWKIWLGFWLKRGEIKEIFTCCGQTLKVCYLSQKYLQLRHTRYGRGNLNITLIHGLKIHVPEKPSQDRKDCDSAEQN